MTVPDTFPDSATVRAVLVRSEWGHYRATLTLPGGRTQTITNDELDGVRAQVIEATRTYLAAELRHPGRLHVEDPEGRWLLGVPHDGGDLVPLPDLPAAPPLTPRPLAPAPVLPSRPAPPGRRRARVARPSVRRQPPSSSRRVGAVAALAVAVLLVAGIVDLTHSTRPPRRAPAAESSRNRPASTHITPAPVTTAPSSPVATPGASPPPRRAPASKHPKPTRRPSSPPRHPSPPKHAAAVHHAPGVAPAPTSSETPTPARSSPPVDSRRSTHSRSPPRAGGGVRLPVPGGPPPL